MWRGSPRKTSGRQASRPEPRRIEHAAESMSWPAVMPACTTCCTTACTPCADRASCPLQHPGLLRGAAAAEAKALRAMQRPSKGLLQQALDALPEQAAPPPAAPVPTPLEAARAAAARISASHGMQAAGGGAPPPPPPPPPADAQGAALLAPPPAPVAMDVDA